MFIFTEKGTKILDGEQRAHEIKTLIINEEDGKIDITIEPYNLIAAKRIQHSFDMFFRIVQIDPERKHSPIDKPYIKNGKFIIQGSVKALQEAITSLEEVLFISSDTSREVEDKLRELEFREANQANELTSLLKK